MSSGGLRSFWWRRWLEGASSSLFAFVVSFLGFTVLLLLRLLLDLLFGYLMSSLPNVLSESLVSSSLEDSSARIRSSRDERQGCH